MLEVSAQIELWSLDARSGQTDPHAPVDKALLGLFQRVLRGRRTNA